MSFQTIYICGQGGETVNGRNISSKFRSGWYASLCRLVVLKCIFMFKSKSLYKSEKLVFFWYRKVQKGTGGTEIYIFVTVWRNNGT